MKNKIIILIMAVLFINSSYALDINAINNLINNNGIEISEEEYERLTSLGFNDVEIINMSIEEYNSNNGLYGEIVSQSIDAPILRDTYTNYKHLKTTIYKLSNGNYRYKVDLDWLKIPVTRSNDVIGIGIDNNISIVGNINSKLVYNDIYTIQSTYYVQTPTGVYSVFNLPNETITQLNISLYFDVKHVKGTVLNVTGDYSHAISDVSFTNVKKASISLTGINFPSDVAGYYDVMAEHKVTYSI